MQAGICASLQALVYAPAAHPGWQCLSSPGHVSISGTLWLTQTDSAVTEACCSPRKTCLVGGYVLLGASLALRLVPAATQGSKFSDAPQGFSDMPAGYSEGLQPGYGELLGGNPGPGGPMGQGGALNGSGAAQQMGGMGGAQMGPGGQYTEEMSIPAPMVRLSTSYSAALL